MMWDGETAATTIVEVDNPIEWKLLLTGQKTQLRSPEHLLPPKPRLPMLVMMRHHGSFAPFVITEMDETDMAGLTTADAQAEGFSDIDAFKRFWMSKVGSAHFSAFERVFVYNLHRFEGVSKINPRGSDILAVDHIIEHLYPLDMA